MKLDVAPAMSPPSESPGSSCAMPAPPGSDDQPSSTIRRRAGIACRRCRRMRSKCHHNKATPPCQACEDAGIGATGCVFPVRGQPDLDRDYRHPRSRAEKASKRDPNKVRRDILDAPVVRQPTTPALAKSVKGADDWDLLPPLPEIIEAVNKFTQHYFQLGFIPKQMFLERLQNNHRSISVFFLLSLLSVSARLSSSLILRFGSAVNASETFMARASAVALEELYKDPDLERCQAFYLLSIAQQGSLMKTKSAINMAIATRMAILMDLHREETYVLTNPTKDLVVRAESARRTMWMLHSQDNLHSGPRTPVSLAASDLTALLPGNEADFAAGREPHSRAALEDTPPALDDPSLISAEGRSLFATLIQTHHYWGAISRRALSYDKSTRPWDPASEFAKMAEKLHAWELKLPHEHQWAAYLLKGYKQERQELAYLAVTNTTRLCNIVLRKAYLHEIISYDKTDPELTHFWSNMSLHLFQNVSILFEQIEAFYADRCPGDSPGAQMAAFCVYTCGFLSSYLCKYPAICPDASIAALGPNIVQRCMHILLESKDIWPLAYRWYEHLVKFHTSDQKNGLTMGKEGSMADSQEPIPHALLSSVDPLALGKLIQPRILAPLDDHHGSSSSDSIRSNSNSSSSSHATNEITAFHQPLGPQPPEASMYLDQSLRLPVSQTQQVTSLVAPNQPPGHSLSPISQHPTDGPSISADLGRSANADGLGLLIQASSFSTHPSAQHMSNLPPGQGGPPNYVPAPADYYGHMTIPNNDGYENELHYCVSDGLPTIQGWAGTNGLYF